MTEAMIAEVIANPVKVEHVASDSPHTKQVISGHHPQYSAHLEALVNRFQHDGSPSGGDDMAFVYFASYDVLCLLLSSEPAFWREPVVDGVLGEVSADGRMLRLWIDRASSHIGRTGLAADPPPFRWTRHDSCPAPIEDLEIDRFNFHYFDQTNSWYVSLRPGDYIASWEVADDFIVDLDSTGRVVGLECMDSLKHMAFNGRAMPFPRITWESGLDGGAAGD